MLSEVSPTLTLCSSTHFDFAYSCNRERKIKEKELFAKLIAPELEITEDVTHEIYAYYGYASSCIIFSMLIPDLIVKI